MRAALLSPVLASFIALTGCIIYIDNGGGHDRCGDDRDDCDRWDECDGSDECDDDWDDDEEWLDSDGDGIPDHEDPYPYGDDEDWDECQRIFDVSVGHESESTGWLAGSWDAGWHGAGWLEGQWTQELGSAAQVTGAWGDADGQLVGDLEGWIFDEDGTLWLQGWAWSEAEYVYFQAPLEPTEEGAQGAGWWSFSEAWIEGVVEETGMWTAEGMHLDFPAHAEGEFLGDCDDDAGGAVIGHYMAESEQGPVDGAIEGAWYEWEAGQSWGWDFGVGEWGWFFGSTSVTDDGARLMGGDGFPFSCE